MQVIGPRRRGIAAHRECRQIAGDSARGAARIAAGVVAVEGVAGMGATTGLDVLMKHRTAVLAVLDVVVDGGKVVGSSDDVETPAGGVEQCRVLDAARSPLTR